MRATRHVLASILRRATAAAAATAACPSSLQPPPTISAHVVTRGYRATTSSNVVNTPTSFAIATIVTNAEASSSYASRVAAATAAAVAAGVGVSVTTSSSSSSISGGNGGGDGTRGSAPQTAFGEGVVVDASTLADLALDIRGPMSSAAITTSSSSSSADDDAAAAASVRIRALRLLARVTLFVDYHDAVIAVPAVVDALRWCVASGAASAEARAAALHCLADLAKEPEVRAALAMDPEALEMVADALSPNFWRQRQGRRRGARSERKRRRNGEDDGSGDGARGVSAGAGELNATEAKAAAADAARLCAELAADDALHEVLISARMPTRLVVASRSLRAFISYSGGGGGGGLAGWMPWRWIWRWRWSRWQTPSSIAPNSGGSTSSTVASAKQEAEDQERLHERDTMRHVAAACYGMARSPEGRSAGSSTMQPHTPQQSS